MPRPPSGFTLVRPSTLLSSTSDGREAHRREPPGAARLPAPRAVRGGDRADRNRGQVAARGAHDDGAGVGGDPRRRGVAAGARDRDVRAGQPCEPRADARAEAAPAPPADRLAVRDGAREGPDGGADEALLQGRAGEGRAGGRPRQGAPGQAARPGRAGREAPDGAGAEERPPLTRATLAARTYGGAMASTWSILRVSCKRRSPVGLLKQPEPNASAENNLALAA